MPGPLRPALGDRPSSVTGVTSCSCDSSRAAPVCDRWGCGSFLGPGRSRRGPVDTAPGVEWPGRPHGRPPCPRVCASHTPRPAALPAWPERPARQRWLRLPRTRPELASVVTRPQPAAPAGSHRSVWTTGPLAGQAEWREGRRLARLGARLWLTPAVSGAASERRPALQARGWVWGPRALGLGAHGREATPRCCQRCSDEQRNGSPH